MSEGNVSLHSVWIQYEDQLRRRARTRLRQYGLTGQTESMDICNDVMADLIRNQTMARHPDQLLGYILRAIDNQVLDTFRTLARQCRDFRRNDPNPVEDFSITAGASSPSQLALRREVVTRICDLLPANDAKAVEMMLENRDWVEIGTAIGLSPDAARMRVRRAIASVRTQIGVGQDNDE